MKDVYLVVCNDRHADVLISVHSKLSGAESRIDDLMEEYDRYEWEEEDITDEMTEAGWISCFGTTEDGPDMRIQKVELEP